MGTNASNDTGSDPFQPGQLVENRYRIERRLNAGGMGVVYEAIHSFTGLRVALKALHNQAGDHPERMQAEARTLAEMRHPNIVQITDGGVTGGVVWFTMELLEGRSLREELNRGAALGVERSLELGIQISQGVAAAHELEVIHRDLKPENVFVLPDGTIKVLDFGTSKITSKLRRSAALKTTDRFRLIGTQAYMPPERLKAEKADARADIYALGHILYEMLASRHCWSDGPGPLDLPDPLELSMRQVYLPPPPLRDFVPDVPDYVERIVLRALAKDPRQRQQSMRQMSAELRSALERWRKERPGKPPAQPRPAAAPIPRTEPLGPRPTAEPFATTTEETALPFGAAGLPIDGLLACGAARFASSEPVPGDIETGLRAIALVDAADQDCRGLLYAVVRLGGSADDRWKAKLRTIVASVGASMPAERRSVVLSIRENLAGQGWEHGTPYPHALGRAELGLGAARLLDPRSRLDSADAALVRLSDADSDVGAFAISVLVAFARTPPSDHPAPRGALLALLLGGPEDSELARSELASFVLSASTTAKGEVSGLTDDPFADRELLASGPSPSTTPTRTSRGPLPPQPSATRPPDAAPERGRGAAVRIPIVIAIAALVTAIAFLANLALRPRPEPTAEKASRQAVAVPPAPSAAAPDTRAVEPAPPNPPPSSAPSAHPRMPEQPSRPAATGTPAPRAAAKTDAPPQPREPKLKLPASGL